MSRNNEIEIENLSPFPQHSSHPHINGQSFRKKSPSPKDTASNGRTPKPQVLNFTKKPNGNHVEIQTSVTDPLASNQETVVLSPKRDPPKSIIMEGVKSLKAEGDTMYNSQQYSEAIGKYKQVLNYLHYDPKHETDRTVINKSIYTKVISNIGQCLSKLERTDEAIVYFSQAVKLEPANIKAYYRLAHLYNKKNDTDRACETLKRGMVYLPDISDEQMRKLFTEYYNHSITLQNNQLDGLKSKMRNFYASGIAQKSETKGILTKSMMTSMVAGLALGGVTTGCIVYAGGFNTNVLLMTLPANLLLWQIVLRSQDRRKKCLALAGLVAVNVAAWKFL